MFSSFTYVMLIITCGVSAITSLDSTAGKCELVPKSDTVGLISITRGPHGRCTNQGNIDGFKECRGACDSSDTYNQKLKEYEATCQCCRVARYSLVPVMLSCESGSQIKYDVATADQCSCKRCGDDTYPEKPPSSMKPRNKDY